jgi:hypothetical protein
MSQTIATPTAAGTIRRMVARVWDDPDSRSTSIGLLAVLLFHVLLWLFGPRLLNFEHIPTAPRPHTTAREFNIELSPETFAKPPPKPKDPFKFVETNPDAPENTPDKTNNFAAQNQQVAQEKPTPDGKSDRPATEGKKDFESNQIVSGRLSQPMEHVEAQPPPSALPEAEQKVAPPKAEQNPLSGVEKFEGENKEGIGGNLAKRLDNARPIPEKIEGVKNAKEFEGATAMQPAIDPRRPRPRPQVTRQQQVRPAILAENKFGTTNIGNIAVDARWSNYGAYLQRMIDTVQIQWERLILQQSANPAVGSTVTVKFIMNDEGKIAQIVNVDSTANETASRACVSAITDRAPYGPWTDDMKAMLGPQQEMTFTFYYQ